MCNKVDDANVTLNKVLDTKSRTVFLTHRTPTKNYPLVKERPPNRTWSSCLTQQVQNSFHFHALSLITIANE